MIGGKCLAFVLSISSFLFLFDGYVKLSAEQVVHIGSQILGRERLDGGQLLFLLACSGRA